ncbi:MAG: MFS transporter [Chloroflexota bacterium]|nr:MFS transporter [Chloroflexota bacterium]
MTQCVLSLLTHGKIYTVSKLGQLMQFRFNRNTKLFLLSTLLYGFSFSVWELFFNLYILSLGFNNDVLGLIRSANPLAALILGLPLGLLSDRIGRRVSMIIGLGICFIGMIFQVHLLNSFIIFLFGLVQGAGLMLYRVAQSPFIMSNSKPNNQAMIFSLNFGLVTIASMIGNLAAGQMPDVLQRWLGIVEGTAASYQWVITAGILLAITSLIPIFLISKQDNPILKPGTFLSPKAMIRKITARPLARQLALINLIMGFGAAILIPYLNVFLRDKFNISNTLLGLLFSLSSLLVFVGSLMGPWLIRITRSRIIPTVATQSASIIFLITLGFSPVLWFSAISMLLRTVLMQMSSPLLENFTMLITPSEDQAAISSVRGVGWQAGQAVGIFISGLVQTRFGFSPLFITTSLCYIFAIVLTWIYFRPLEKSGAHDS